MELTTEIWLNSKISPNLSNVHPIKRSLFPISISSNSVAGKSHFYNDNEVVVNEDICGTFEFNSRTEYINKSTEFPTDYDDIVTGIFLADGHGENRIVPKDSSKWIGSGGERFVAIVQKNITTVLKSIFQMANYGVKRDLEMEKRYKYFYPTTKEEQEKKLENSFLKHLREGMRNFHRMMDQTLSDEDPSLCNDNGSTICICLIWRNYLFCLNIGDSNMMIFDPLTGKALKVWKRPQKDDMYNVCSYDDTLASYPDYLHEGQTLYSVKQDYNFISEYCKQFATLKGRYFYSLTSPSSIYGLSLTNTLGNRNHAGRTLGRTSVYEFNIQSLLEKTEGNRFSIMCVTDGIKDVLDSTEIGSFLSDFQNGIDQKYEKIKEEVENERRRREIYRKYEMEFDTGVRSKSTNNLSSVLVVENTLKEMTIDDPIVNNMDLQEVKNKLKKIIQGYNKEKPLDIYDTNSLNIILKTFKENNINSFKNSDYYTSISNTESNSNPNEESISQEEQQLQQSQSTNSPSKSYYHEFLVCLTNFASLCQTLDDCTAINMEITGINPSLLRNDEETTNTINSTNTNEDKMEL
ncbi:hypothetical protein H8356DRAFT_1650735 [Neocallimastix lanati (nom. inval.)]|jgi:serine/threonine protein phosphatase PrpC|uniref:PPM-type phosphatase domain-containing protein n=1 Tax=Neocallimastix californiae TaxID=1754190 RepID=A0A1Y2FDP1_9FUNG|nr:hypothetical protein H8356DRAFT_1650735 [Neocallimastix sp. JGI-2020a]ORY81727.1 hypothetical protein LY90DRAFT_664263 [Neocallimastix californiae]|eukprot:ORY81727.1 hypothetical protein LY90DRAFT_664263 [Neocallimastix californiae]